MNTCSASTVSTVAWGVAGGEGGGQPNTLFFSSICSKNVIDKMPFSALSNLRETKQSQLLYATATDMPLDTCKGKQLISRKLFPSQSFVKST